MKSKYLDEDSKVIIEKYISKASGKEEKRQYLKGNLIAKGSFSEVYEFIEPNNNLISAGKIIPKNLFKKFKEEIFILKNLHHPNIISFEKTFEDSENIYLLTEFCPNGTMADLLTKRKELTEFEIQIYIIQIINILKYLRNNNIIHRDLKLSHFVFSKNMELKLCGFHLAIKFKEDNQTVKGRSGTLDYMAPEVVDSKKYYSYEIDLWSLGILIYRIIIGKFPFRTTIRELTENKIKSGEYSFPKNKIINENAKDLIRKLLILDPKKRLNLEQILDHNFFKNITKIPKAMPLSTLKEAPPFDFIREYISNNYVAKNTFDKNVDNSKDQLINNLEHSLSKEKDISIQLSKKIKELEKNLKNEKEKNIEKENEIKELNEIIKALEFSLNKSYNNKETIQLMNQIISKDEEIRELKSRFPFELEKGEKIMSVIFISLNQEIHQSIICKDTDIFSKIENLLYDEYPKYRESNNIFICNGNKVDRNKNLRENKIENSAVIILKQIDEYYDFEE